MKTYVTNMTEGKPVRLIVSFAIPLMIGNIFQQLYLVADSMVVGTFLGVDALAALGICGWPSWIVIGMLQGQNSTESWRSPLLPSALLL